MPSSTGEPRGQVQQDRLSSESTSKITSIEAERSEPRQSFRVAKAIGLHPSTNTAVMLDRQSSTISAPVEMVASVVETSTNPVEEYHGNASNAVSLDSTKSFTSQRVADTVDRIRNSAVKKDSKITWILTTNKTGGRSKYEQEEKIDENGNRNDTTLDQVEDLTVLPLQEEVSRIRLVLNKTKSSSLLSSSSSSLSSSAGSSSIKTFNRSDDVEINDDDDDFVEPQLFATAASILEGICVQHFNRSRTKIVLFSNRIEFRKSDKKFDANLIVGVSEPTRLSRARSAFPKDFQRDQVQEDHLSDYNESNSENSKRENTSRSTVDIAAITGSCLATVVLLSTMGSLGFIMYR